LQGSLYARVRQPLSLEERARLAYHTVESVASILQSLEMENVSAFLPLLFRDIQRSQNWLVLYSLKTKLKHKCQPTHTYQVLDGGRPVLCGSIRPESKQADPEVALSPEMRIFERLRERQKSVPHSPLRLFALEPGEDEATWSWGLAPLSSPCSSLESALASPQLAFALGILLYEIFTGKPVASARQSNEKDDAPAAVVTSGQEVAAEKQKTLRRLPAFRVPIELPLAVRQLLQWTWAWEREERKSRANKENKNIRANAMRKAERRPSLPDIMRICFWLGHETTQIDADGSHSLSMRDFGPGLTKALNQSGKNQHEDDVEEIDEETRESLVLMLAETEKNLMEKALKLRPVRQEQRREHFWKVSGSDLFSDSDDNTDEDDELEDEVLDTLEVRSLFFWPRWCVLTLWRPA